MSYNNPIPSFAIITLCLLIAVLVGADWDGANEAFFEWVDQYFYPPGADVAPECDCELIGGE